MIWSAFFLIVFPVLATCYVRRYLGERRRLAALPIWPEHYRRAQDEHNAFLDLLMACMHVALTAAFAYDLGRQLGWWP